MSGLLAELMEGMEAFQTRSDSHVSYKHIFFVSYKQIWASK